MARNIFSPTGDAKCLRFAEERLEERGLKEACILDSPRAQIIRFCKGYLALQRHGHCQRLPHILERSILRDLVCETK